MGLEAVGSGRGIRLLHILGSRAVEVHVGVALLVNHKLALLALVALLSQAPHKLLAVTAVGWALEELGLELVASNLVNLRLTHGAGTGKLVGS